MAKRRISLSSQEMNDIKAKIKNLEAQLKRSNARVDELESGLNFIKQLIEQEDAPDSVEALGERVIQLVDVSINPPVKVKRTGTFDEELEALMEEDE